MSGNGEGDKGMSPTAMPLEKVHGLVKGVSVSAMDTIRSMEEQCATLRRAFQEREEAIARDIVGLGELAQQVIDVRPIVGDALSRIASDIHKSPLPKQLENRDMPKLPPSFRLDKLEAAVHGRKGIPDNTD